MALDDHLATGGTATLRYRVLHVAARLVHGQRRRRLKIPLGWPWAGDLHRAFDRVLAIPTQARLGRPVPPIRQKSL